MQGAILDGVAAWSQSPHADDVSLVIVEAWLAAGSNSYPVLVGFYAILTLHVKLCAGVILWSVFA
jgi:hypothetical protein